MVVILGIAVLMAFATLVFLVMTRTPPGGDGAPAAVAARTPAVSPTASLDTRGWGRLILDQPPGTRIQAVTSLGALAILHLYTGSPGIDERLIVIDPQQGRIVGTITLGPR
ncbi:MAG: hypothetical protein ACKVPY_02645 [Paracoccaceae bacterium]